MEEDQAMRLVEFKEEKDLVVLGGRTGRMTQPDYIRIHLGASRLPYHQMEVARNHHRIPPPL